MICRESRSSHKLSLFVVLSGLVFLFSFQKVAAGDNHVQHPLYVGVAGGWGSTTWSGLVPSVNDQNEAMNISTPIRVEEGGGVFGLFAGYELFRFFAVEANYMKYPKTKVIFDSMSLFSFKNDGLETFSTHTEVMSLMGKVIATIPSTVVKIYSSAGVARIHRDDLLVNSSRLSPSFAVGFNYDFTPHIMGEITGSYTAGYGEAKMNPTETYYPFLYSVYVRLGYRF